MSVLDELNWRSVREQYDVRLAVHSRLNRLFFAVDPRPFFELALGISDSAANYSASDHGLGPKIRSENVDPERRVHQLAGQFRGLQRAGEVPEIIRQANIKYLSIGVGSELSCLMNPTICWVANTRSIWTHLIVKHADNYARANEELALYRTADVTSEMAYAVWSAIHAELDVALTRLSDEGSLRARRAEITPGEIKYLRAVAIANAVYEAHYPGARHRRSYQTR
jgi:hypothetical protein